MFLCCYINSRSVVDGGSFSRVSQSNHLVSNTFPSNWGVGNVPKNTSKAFGRRMGLPKHFLSLIHAAEVFQVSLKLRSQPTFSWQAAPNLCFQRNNKCHNSRGNTQNVSHFQRRLNRCTYALFDLLINSGKILRWHISTICFFFETFVSCSSGAKKPAHRAAYGF